jgi:hypothetical protein
VLNYGLQLALLVGRGLLDCGNPQVEDSLLGHFSLPLHAERLPYSGRSPALGVTTNGRVPTLEEAKAPFKSSWSKVSEAREQKERQQP